MVPLDDRVWINALSCLDYAFQPILNIYSGECYGYEALLRGVDGAGFASIHQFMDTAAESGLLHQVDLRLREIAVKKFSAHSSPLWFDPGTHLL
jgi:EAL domain-containing protein (putative c-di-GMP-specific phosphodiesterase class I)